MYTAIADAKTAGMQWCAVMVIHVESGSTLNIYFDAAVKKGAKWYCKKCDPTSTKLTNVHWL